MEGGRRGILPLILYLGFLCRSVVSFTSLPLYFWGPLNRGYLGPMGGLDLLEQGKDLLSLPRIVQALA
jgi:hypothetical protein